MKLTVSFFDRGPSCPTDRAPSPFFGFVLFVLFIFYFWFVFFSLVPDCTTTQRKFSPAVKYPFFAAQTTFFWVATVFFLFFPCTHSGQVEQASMVLRRRPFHHKDDDTREALPATLSSTKCSRSSSEIWTIFTNSPMISFDHPTLSGPKQGLSVDSLFLISFSC